MIDEKNKTVELSCHCGEVKLILPHFVDVVTDCNCSICYRHAALWGYYEKNSYQVVGKKKLQSYSHGDKNIIYYSCNNCMCITHYESTEKSGVNIAGINFRLYAGNLPESTRIRKFDGAVTWQEISD